MLSLIHISERHQPLFSYFRQLFAQVTNPPIDAIREKIVTDTAVYVGSDGNLLEDTPENCAVLRLEKPILSNSDLQRIRSSKAAAIRPTTISMLYYRTESLERALNHLFIACDRAYKNGFNVLIPVSYTHLCRAAGAGGGAGLRAVLLAAHAAVELDRPQRHLQLFCPRLL